MEILDSLLRSALAELEQNGLRRNLRVVEAVEGARITMGGRELINFSSNDYLGLAGHPVLAEAMHEAALQWGAGSTASRLICGTTAEHAALEEELAVAKGTQAALVFSTGVAAATGTIPALAGKGDVVILEKLSHACLVDGARASEATLRVYPHNDLDRLESHLKWARENHPGGKIMIITESVFSMDGDLAPLREILELKERYGAILLLDEAHAVGVRGAGAQGLAGELGFGGRVEIQMGTLGKALGVAGGYIAGSRVLVDFLINRARSFVFSTAPSPATAAACRAALRILQSEEGTMRQLQLQKNIRLLAAELNPNSEVDGEQFGLKATPPPAAIVPWILGSEERALAESIRLTEAGFFVPAIRYPTVPRNTSRLRITLSAVHDPTQIRDLARALLRVDEGLHHPSRSAALC
jgi:8-amino-7-oxononanoate synthase